jgi:3',5'-nucleoside bisphosphate phosphatase
MHTTASDGSTPPADLVRLARAKGLTAIAISDHDTTEGLAQAMDAGRKEEVEVVAAVEMSTDVDDGEVHILGYFLSYGDAQFQSLLSVLREARLGRAHKMVDKLAGLGMPLEWARVKAFAGDGAVGRPHVAKAMVERGYVTDIKSAFNMYIGRNGPAYVERYKLTPVEAIAAIRGVGGLAVLAHPLEGHGCLGLVPELVAAGLGGMECYYTGYTSDMTEALMSIARKHGLVPSGGSDFHGEGVAANAVLGQPPIPDRVLEGMRRAWQSVGS